MNPSPSSRGGRVEGGGGSAKKPQPSGEMSTPLVLPKEVLLRCVGVPVLVSLRGGSSTGGDDGSYCVHELSGTLQQYDEDCNLLLTEVVHYELKIPPSTTLEGGDNETTSGEKRERQEDAPAPTWRVVRQCRKAMIGGDRVAQVVPNPMMDALLRLEVPAGDATTSAPPTL